MARIDAAGGHVYVDRSDAVQHYRLSHGGLIDGGMVRRLVEKGLLIGLGGSLIAGEHQTFGLRSRYP